MVTTIIWLVVLPALLSIPFAHSDWKPGPEGLDGWLKVGVIKRWVSSGRVEQLTNCGNGSIERQETPGSSSEASAMEGTEI